MRQLHMTYRILRHEQLDNFQFPRQTLCVVLNRLGVVSFLCTDAVCQFGTIILHNRRVQLFVIVHWNFRSTVVEVFDSAVPTASWFCVDLIQLSFYLACLCAFARRIVSTTRRVPF
jgi:hypothetical protein